MSKTTSPEKRKAMIRLSGVSKQYPGTDKAAVEPLDLEIMEGEFVCLLGPSGCGKTTTLRMINRLVEPTSGQIWIDGKDVTLEEPNQLRRRVGYVIQQVGLLPHMTIEQNVGIVPKMLGWEKDRTAQRVTELLSLVGLEPSEFRDRYPKQLSGGQQQRVGVARALAADPPVLLMDEPFGAIDPITRDRLQEELLQLQSRIRKTIVFVTHDVGEAVRLSDRVAIFAENSRIAQFATPLEILSAPADDFVRSFVGKGSSVRRLELLTLGDLSLTDSLPDDPTAIDLEKDTAVNDALEQMLQLGVMNVRLAGMGTFSAQQILAASVTKRSAA